ncbi:unnamed protein product [Bemisia tabaci]|uniref:Uncharacterized protein n=1 Tax=Bemisia tabaci TaxID=7038 RepID=A0A9P0F7Z2_BEMTA|nr:unnamed protein product [Bemisia tabaci]
MNFQTIEVPQKQLPKGYFDFVIVKVPLFDYRDNSTRVMGTNVRISYGDPKTYICIEDRVFPGENVTLSPCLICPPKYETLSASFLDGYQKVSSSQDYNNEDRDCVFASPVEITGNFVGLYRGLYNNKRVGCEDPKSETLLNSTRTVFTHFDPFEGDITIEIDRIGLKFLDNGEFGRHYQREFASHGLKYTPIEDWNSLISNWKTYMRRDDFISKSGEAPQGFPNIPREPHDFDFMTIIMRKPYTNFLTRRSSNFTLVCNDAPATSRYVIDLSLPFHLLDSCPTTQIEVINENLDMPVMPYLFGTTQLMTYVTNVQDKDVYNNIRLTNSSSLVLSLNNTLIGGLTVNTPSTTLTFGETTHSGGRMILSSIKVEEHVKFFRISTMQSSIVSLDISNLYPSLDTSFFCEKGIMNLKMELMREEGISNFIIQVEFIVPILNSISYNRKFKYLFDATFSNVFGCFARNVREGDIWIFQSLLSGIRVNIFPEYIVINDFKQNRTEVINNPSSNITIEQELMFVGIYKLQDTNSRYQNNPIMVREESWWILNFKNIHGAEILHHVNVNSTGIITVNNINYDVQGGNIRALFSESIDEAQLLRFESDRTVPIYIETPLREIVIQVDDDYITLNNVSIYTGDETELIFQDSSEEQLTFNVGVFRRLNPEIDSDFDSRRLRRHIDYFDTQNGQSPDFHINN